jgi:hypothetical protein
MNNILNEINLIKYLTDYKRGIVISEQETYELISEGSVDNCISRFQNWVSTTKQDPDSLGPKGVDGKWGPMTSGAFTKYGDEYSTTIRNSNDVTNFQNYVKNTKGDSKILGSTGVDGNWGDKTKSAWDKYGSSYISSACKKTKSSDGNKKTDETSKSCSGGKKIPKFEKVNTCLSNSTKSVELGKSSVTDCAAFVNAFSDRVSYVGNAWFSHDLDSAGKRKFSVYTSVSDSIKEEARKLFNSIWKKGGWEKAPEYKPNVKTLQSKLIPNQSSLSSKLVKGDIVGIYYPSSSHHVEAFYQAATGKDGKGNSITPSYVVTDSSGKFVMGPTGFPKLGKTWNSGRLWSMNTHLGIVGEVKNGVPIIFHNIGGTVYADPIGKLQGDGKIMWIKST